MSTKHAAIIGFGTLLLVGIAVEVIREVSTHARKSQVHFVTRQLALSIDTFRRSQGYYPRTLTDLLTSASNDERLKNALQELIGSTYSNSWHDKYYYTPSTNGFSITVVGPDAPPLGWFGRQRTLEKHYQAGEAIK